MRLLYHAFGTLHPCVGCIYFLFVFCSCFLSRDPVWLGLCLCSALLSRWAGHGPRSIWNAFLLALPTAGLLFFITPLFNHNGATPLFYLNGMPITLEAGLYGIVTAMAIVNTMLWFLIANDTIDYDKIIYLLGRPFPTSALLLGAIFRTTVSLQDELRNLRLAQYGLGVRTDGGRLAQRTQNAARLFLSLTGNALEHSVDTAMAMKGRGYGLPGGSKSRQYRFGRRDTVILLAVLLLVGCLAWLVGSGAFRFTIFPSVSAPDWAWTRTAGYLLYGLFLNLPLLYDWKEATKWRYLH